MIGAKGTQSPVVDVYPYVWQCYVFCNLFMCLA